MLHKFPKKAILFPNKNGEMCFTGFQKRKFFHRLLILAKITLFQVVNCSITQNHVFVYCLFCYNNTYALSSFFLFFCAAISKHNLHTLVNSRKLLSMFKTTFQGWCFTAY